MIGLIVNFGHVHSPQAWIFNLHYRTVQLTEQLQISLTCWRSMTWQPNTGCGQRVCNSATQYTIYVHRVFHFISDAQSIAQVIGCCELICFVMNDLCSAMLCSCHGSRTSSWRWRWRVWSRSSRRNSSFWTRPCKFSHIDACYKWRPWLVLELEDVLS